jgi:hypothetical protein
MKRALELTRNTQFLLVIYVVFAVLSKASWPLNWVLNLLAWACLIYAYETAQSFRKFLLALCIAALIESGISTSWLLAYRSDAYLVGWLLTVALVATLFAFIHVLRRLISRIHPSLLHQ